MEDQKLHTTNHITQHIYENLLERLGEAFESLRDWEKQQSDKSTDEESTDLEVSRDANISVERSTLETPDFLVNRTASTTVEAFPDLEVSRDISNIAVERTDQSTPDVVANKPIELPPNFTRNTSVSREIPELDIPSFNRAGNGNPENESEPLLDDDEAKEKKAPELPDESNSGIVTVEKRAPTKSFQQEDTGILYSSAAGNALADKLTKEDAAAVAAMLSGKTGDKIPDAANLRISINGKVIAEADAYGNLTTGGTSEQSKSLSQHFSALATEEKRPSKLDGIEKMSEIASFNPNADGHQFMQRLARDFEALHSPDMPRVREREGLALSKPTIANASAIMNLYATKEPDEDAYKLKDGGSILAQPGTDDRSDYQFFEVRDAAGNVDMGFTVCPGGRIVLDPKISSTLQSQIDLMEQAWDKGLYDDDTPLMSEDKARAEAVYAFQQNVTSPKMAKKNNLPLNVKTDPQGNITATSKTNPQAKIQFNATKDGGFRIPTNTLTTPDLLEFNKAFAQTNTRSAKTSSSTKPKTERKTATAAKKPRNQMSM